MKRHYTGLTKRMLSEIESISDQMSHSGERGRNNEAVVGEFLKRHLPTQYTVSTGKVVGVGGKESGQVDLIIHDRLTTPAFVDAHEWSLVPIESVHAVISVKTTLTKPELRDAMKSIETVRSLPRGAATLQIGERLVLIPEKKVLRPRALIFGFKSTWTAIDGCRKAFIELLDDFGDSVRPNGVCALDHGFVVRKPYTTDTVLFVEHALMHFFVFLVMNMGNRPKYGVDLTQYFSDDYGQSGARNARDV